jgi:hypothetical protein
MRLTTLLGKPGTDLDFRARCQLALSVEIEVCPRFSEVVIPLPP